MRAMNQDPAQIDALDIELIELKDVGSRGCGSAMVYRWPIIEGD